MSKVEFSRGLEGVIVAETGICSIDGAKGKLYYRGYHIEDLLQERDFEDVSFLLYFGELPTTVQRNMFCEFLCKTRVIPQTLIDAVQRMPRSLHPMEVMQSLVPMLTNVPVDMSSVQKLFSDFGLDGDSCGRDLALISQIGCLTSMVYRSYHGKSIILPHDSLGHAANMLYMMSGKTPTQNETKAFDQCLSLHAEHGFNASTFTARVVASTLAPTVSAVSAGYGALFGPLHGGANEKVMQMVAAIASPEHTETWIKQRLKNKEKVMGLGHRVYKTRDPRANAIETLLEVVSEEHNNTTNITILRIIEKVVRENLGDKPIHVNVDFFSGSVYEQLGIPPTFYTPMFGAARVSGWIAHVREQRSDNRIYRPGALYIGPTPRNVTL